MAQFFSIHPTHPQGRLIKLAVDIIRAEGVIVYPTDSSYALACSIDNKSGLDRIRTLRRLDDHHLMTLVCQNMTAVNHYAKIDNFVFRIIKAHTPGPYTFILNATREVPKRLMHPKRKSIGIRIPHHTVTQALLAALGEPLMSTSCILPTQSEPMISAEEIRDALEKQVELVIDGGPGGLEPTSIIDLSGEHPIIVRHGKGDVGPFT